MSLIKPDKLVLPFANSGTKNVIPIASQIGITGGSASYTDGFPPITFIPVPAGGIPPSGKDMNGAMYELTDVIRWLNAGGGFEYDPVFANDENVDGYPLGAKVMRSDGTGYWLNTIADNKVDPESSGAAVAGWVPDFTNGIATIALSSLNVTLTPAQYGKPIIALTGTIIANLNLIFPDIADDWSIINNTSGLFTITCKTATGTGVIASPGANSVICDGTNFNLMNTSEQMSFANVCQTVSSGPSDTNNFPTFFPSTSISLDLTTQNISTGFNALNITAANGFNLNGSPKDIFKTLTGNITFIGCTASQTNYFPISADDGIPQNPVVLVPIYQEGGAPSATNGQYTYVKNRRQMYLGNGSIANAVNHVIVGECVAGASSITSATAYAYQRKYMSASQSITTAGGITLSHNIGTFPYGGVKFLATMVNTVGGYTPGMQFYILINNSDSGASRSIGCSVNRLSVVMKGNNTGYTNFVSLADGGQTYMLFPDYTFQVIIDGGW